ncbi:DUF998 domain-containing protein [Photobacterium sp. 1_MG-2023]|uniref:DUF998 domain-containing protein n=1 Tax=Photobacterium sp. 1_MG-2023 TaxID=3062646 RepID=UPI0026E284B1|nr:DUF998 domain-containing protein [Photobacterium sp. 1_MG-2023]MDO6707389.1 DUF998 domain-containing protein [Photobacterium sp. 1_MG-2023]
MESWIQYTGIVASVWIIMGIFVASLFYPNYSHSRQFCSELGAFGSPTQKLSPLINNYPLGVLFILYGYFITTTDVTYLPTFFVGAMVIVHGLSTWICGFFPMDADPYTSKPSMSGHIHAWSGMVMLLSLIIAPSIIVFSAAYPLFIRLFSLVCIVGCLFFSYRLAIAFKAKTVPGIYQRFSYGFQILWLFGYSFFELG